MVLEEPEVVTQPVPLDVSGVRDNGMKALILLAVSLGWNVMQKHSQPVVITSRDGTQKRLPTNTSIRMSVFQTALSTIMAHTYDYDPTVELIDAIIAITKPSRDHERRLRLAVGETSEEHRQRVANDKAAERKREPDEHLTQRIEITTEEEVPVYLLDEPMLEEQEVPVELEWEDPSVEVMPRGDWELPVDGGEHGKMLSREPFMAHHHSNAKGHKGMAYQSDTSFERVWEDGFKDYECMICGQVYAAPRGVGSHRQIHTKRGEIPPPTEPAWKRSPIHMIDPDYVAKTRGRPKKEKEEPKEVTLAVEVTGFIPFEGTDAETLLEQVIELVAPMMVTRHQQQMEELEARLQAADARVREVEGEFDALVDLLNNRRRTDG
jgi:hypothetical protein